MKNSKYLLTILLLLLATNLAKAQDEAYVAVTALVQDNLVLTPTAISLGTIQAGSNSIISGGNDGLTTTNVGTNASAGALKIEGSNGVSVNVSWENNVVLCNENQAECVDFTPVIVDPTNSNAIIPPTGGNVTLDATNGITTLQIGGTLNLEENPTTEGYTGTFSTATAGSDANPLTIAVQYN